jgi:hypothetical protein
MPPSSEPHLGFAAFDHLSPESDDRQQIMPGKKKILHQPHSPA